MSSLSNANQYRHVTRLVSSVVGYWTSTHGVMGSDSGQVKTFVLIHTAAMLLFYSIQNINVPKFCFSENPQSYIIVWPNCKWG
jgi:hypothetical protein